jgi:hypothetical protein
MQRLSDPKIAQFGRTRLLRVLLNNHQLKLVGLDYGLEVLIRVA